MTDNATSTFAEPSTSVTPQVEPLEVTQNTNQYADALSTIVNDEGTQKYADVPTALGALVHSQTHIKTMESELAALRESVSKNTAAEDLLQQVKEGTNTTSVTPASVNANEVAQVVEQVVSQRELATVAAANQAEVNKALVTKYGSADKAKEAFVNRAGELGLGVAALDKLSAESPTAVLKWFDTTVEKLPSKTSSTLSTEDFARANTTDDVAEHFKGIMGYTTGTDVANAWNASKASVLSKT